MMLEVKDLRMYFPVKRGFFRRTAGYVEAVDGVSLSVFSISGRRFSVALIPHTLKLTTLGRKGPGAAVNVESDMLVKYVERILAGRSNGAAHKASRRPAGTAIVKIAIANKSASANKTAGGALSARGRGASS